ncbi:hypothetical protein CAMSH0001_2246 [Campylobacter showae RM3277]|uniref:Uncharacterized protein n=1 Tax=Campylobacter showae RM3277 TaxID=553219 RepID=C6RFY3_9BACT|nr:hypothetical protein CAMSH0001_2246 [Campylobacter showae RM3277]
MRRSTDVLRQMHLKFTANFYAIPNSRIKNEFPKTPAEI